MATVKIKDKGQITVPKELRDQLGLSIGDDLEAMVIGGEIRLKPIRVLIVPKNEQWAWEPEAVLAMEEGQKLYKEGKLKVYTKDNIAEMFESWNE